MLVIIQRKFFIADAFVYSSILWSDS